MTYFEISKQYLIFGFTHVIPYGFDHILFILSLFFLNSNLKSVIIQCSVFTLAHSLSLGITAAGYIMPNEAIIEPLIALSILFTAVENIVHNKVNSWRILVIFVFGIIHGMGFASALKEVGLQKGFFINSLLFFNIGVEIGQITIILLAYFLIAKWTNKKVWYTTRVVYPVSALIGSIALYWMIERMIL
jgi:hypothetical protein